MTGRQQTIDVRKGTQLTVNGHRPVYTVTKVTRDSIDLRGPRGGRAVLERNVPSNVWALIKLGSRSPKSEPVETVEVVG